MKKWQQTQEVKTKTKQNKQTNKTKLMNILRHRMVTVDTVKKNWKNAVLAKYAANYWLTYDRNGKHATNFMCLL